ncbi:hypothetical protein BsWGS_05095 [Bradybaena similaris]
MILLATENVTLASRMVLNFTTADLSILIKTLGSNYTTMFSNETAFLSTTASTASNSFTSIEDHSEQGFIVAKITILLIVTAVVLIVSYKFVIRLFLGYADRKDDVMTDGISDDEDSAVIKRAAEHIYEIG